MTNKNLYKVINHVLLLCGSVVMLFPFLWMVLVSLKTKSEAKLVPPTFFPMEPQWENYVKLFKFLPFSQLYFNTIISTVFITLGQVTICALAAYAFARISFPFKNILFLIILSVLMVPSQVFLIPQYLIIQKMGLLDSISALVIPNLFSAFGTFLLRQFFMTLPKELEEAAELDGWFVFGSRSTNFNFPHIPKTIY